MISLIFSIFNLANGDTKAQQQPQQAGAAGMSRSVPSSPGDRKQGSIPIVGSAEDLVGRVCDFTPSLLRTLIFS